MTPTQILCIGVNHQSAPLAVREAMACAPPVIDPRLGRSCPHIDEWVMISTCNRVEMYVVTAGEIEFDGPRDLLLASCVATQTTGPS